MPVIEGLKNRREKIGLTQHELAEKSGVSIRTLTRAENGRGVILSVAKAVERVITSFERKGNA